LNLILKAIVRVLKTDGILKRAEKQEREEMESSKASELDLKDGQGSSVMISYCRKDKTFVKQLHDALQADGRHIWVDWADIPPSAEWLDEIHQGIALVSLFLI
jgi:hypothetical protein